MRTIYCLLTKKTEDIFIQLSMIKNFSCRNSGTGKRNFSKFIPFRFIFFCLFLTCYLREFLLFIPPLFSLFVSSYALSFSLFQVNIFFQCQMRRLYRYCAVRVFSFEIPCLSVSIFSKCHDFFVNIADWFPVAFH